ncbi:RHS repeat domain-containing protein [Photorhabdus caribbeanensis]|uniref:RHS repeat domain-containing protein n=1 Tax=Photorhabdus caribbeanensis TaxID=1004165 RepID=UPI001BD1FE5D|nr:RHS repeat domain-containing protein [Photorhabdus caribbeanensis]MBS9423685.1 RHS repeat protein [Photorhabdus caribbeanensis]
MENIDPKLYQHTPTVSVHDNRGLAVRNISFHRATTEANIDTRITRHQYNAGGYLNQSIDPRLYDAKQTDNTVKPNFIWQHNLTGNILRTESVDAGRAITLNDIEGRPVLTINATGVRQNHRYENNTLPGRLLAITEQVQTEEKTTERLIWAGNTPQEKEHNLAGQCTRHYDTAGLTQLNSLALTGAVLSQSQQLLIDNQNADWTGEDQSLWQQKLNSDVYTTQSSIDATGALLTQTDAKGNIQRQAYDVAGQLKESWLTLKGQAEQVIIKSLTYSAAGQKLCEEHGNGVITEYSYEPETQRLIGITTRRPSDTKVLQDLRYQYDPVGNVISIRNDAEATRFWRNQKIAPENSYTYDSLYQLISATGREMANIGQQNNQLPSPALPSDNNTYTNYTRSYTYDRGGNLTKIQHSSPATQNNYTTNITVSNRSNRAVLSTLTEDPTQVDALFDAGGHQTSLLPGQVLAWTPRGELKQANSSAGNEWYRYDSNGIRQLKVNEQQNQNIAQQQRVIYLPGLELRATQHGSTTTEYLQVITLGKAGRAQVRVLHWESGKPTDINNNQLRYSYDNLIGSSQLELDSEGQIISEEEYYPFGGTALWAARNQTEASYKTIRYSGKERDTTGLYYYGHRYYQPWAGRWLSADPAGTIDGLNLYRMVRNNPVTQFDVQGLSPANRTEEAIIKQGSFTGMEEAVYKKMATSQTFKRQRAIAAQTEQEAHELLTSNPGVDISPIKNYTTDSSQINSAIRENRITPAVEKLDSTLSALQDRQMRVTYRVMTYVDNSMPSPWHSPQEGNSINVGDIVSDNAYSSTSAHRGFLSFVHKKETSETRYVKMAFLTNTGVNVSAASMYNNAGEEQVFKMDLNDSRKSLADKLKLRVSGPQAGQAEILLPRETPFEVISMRHQGRDTYVLLQDIKPSAITHRNVRNTYTGNFKPSRAD